MLAKEAGYQTGWKNPRRFWMMGRLTAHLVGEPATSEGLAFNLVAKMEMPTGVTPAAGQAALAHRPGQIQRMNAYEYLSGPVFLLLSPEGITWVMQTYTIHNPLT